MERLTGCCSESVEIRSKDRQDDQHDPTAQRGRRNVVSSSIRLVDVVCKHNGEVIATYEFGFSVSSEASSSFDFDREALIREAKSNLSSEKLAEPPFDGITFEISLR
jgi:hypothetical protein